MKLFKYLGLLIPTMLLALSSCSKDEIVERGAEEAPQTERKITLLFPDNTLAEPTTYAGTFAADAEEKAISHARMFIFSDDGNNQPDELIGVEELKLEAGDNEVGVKAHFFLPYDGKLHLVATANLKGVEKKIENLKGGKFKDFSRMLITQPAGEANFFPMVSEPVSIDYQIGGTAPTMKFILERLSVRIDIENHTFAVPGKAYAFTLKEARMKDVDLSQSYLVKGQLPKLYAGDAEGTILLVNYNWIPCPSGSTKLYKSLYTYENLDLTTPSSLVKRIEVAGTMFNPDLNQEVEVQFNCEIKQELKRNTRYVLRLENSEDKNKLGFKLVVKDWDEGGVIEKTPEVDKSQPLLKAINGSGKHNLQYKGTQTMSNVSGINVTTPDAYKLNLKLESEAIGSRILINKADYPWLSIKEVGQASIQNGKFVQTFEVSLGKNIDYYARTAELELQNAYSPNPLTSQKIRLVQARSKARSFNLLSYLANANIGELNTFTQVPKVHTVGDPEVAGKFYQWGRNIPISYDWTQDRILADYSNQRSNGNDPLLWTKNMIVAGGSTTNKILLRTFDFNVGLKPGSTWKEVVAKATNAPAYYKGNNGGDPSPKGYHIPSSKEIQVIMPSHKSANPSFFANRIKETGSKKLAVPGESNIEEWDYEILGGGFGHCYVITLKRGYNNKYLTAYHYEWLGKGAKITARHLGAKGANLKVENIANEKYWAQNAGSDIVRVLTSGGLSLDYRKIPFSINSFGLGRGGSGILCSDIWAEDNHFHFSSLSNNIVYLSTWMGCYSLVQLRPIRNY